MQDAEAGRTRDRLLAEREGIQHRLEELDNPNVTHDQDIEQERESLAARLRELDSELGPLNEWFDRQPPDERPI
jgi:hypothetical protein